MVVAGHRGDVEVARAALDDDDTTVRVAALGALDRAGTLTDELLLHAFDDPDAAVRVRAVELAASRPDVDLCRLLDDDDADVVEVAAWACGERPAVADDVLARLIELTTQAVDALVREAAVAALGALGDARAVPAIIAATSDKPAVRRRAVLALAPFEGAEVDAALQRALDDRDWQVRQAAHDLLDDEI